MKGLGTLLTVKREMVLARVAKATTKMSALMVAPSLQFSISARTRSTTTLLLVFIKL